MNRAGRWLRRFGVALLALAVLLVIPVLPRITIPRVAAPAGARTIALVVNRGYDINTVGEAFLGSQYRDLWSEPITVEVLDLGTFDGGLRPIREGGGQETRSLHFESAGGHHFTFRSVDKEVLRLLHSGLGKSPVAWLVHDQTSSSFPAGALVANPIQEAAGLASGHPRLVVMPDDPSLGQFRERFSGILGLLQEGPEDYVRRLPGAEGVREVKDTDAILPLVDSTSQHRIDAGSFLTARLLDAFLNDWDRHAGQWRWAPIGEAWGIRWLAIPVDRDQAFSAYDGLLMALARLRTRKLAEFGPDIPSVPGLTHNSRALDRRFLAGLERPIWDSAVARLVDRLSDSVIDAAVRRLPPEYYARSGAWLAATLKLRRERLVAHAGAFYLSMAHRSEVYATREAEIAHLLYRPDGGVELRLSRGVGDGQEGPWFLRRYRPEETERIDLHLGGGKDRIVVTGTPSRTIEVVVFDSTGRQLSLDQFRDSSAIRP